MDLLVALRYFSYNWALRGVAIGEFLWRFPIKIYLKNILKLITSKCIILMNIIWNK